LKQTGLEGTPTAPFVSSLQIVAYENADTPDLRPLVEAAWAAFAAAREAQLQSNDLRWKDLHFSRFTVDGRDRAWHWKSGRLNEDLWEESLDGVPELFSEVHLSVPQWGRLRYLSDCPAGPRSSSLYRMLALEIRNMGQDASSASHQLLDVLRHAATIEGIAGGFVHLDSIADPYSEVVDNWSRLAVNEFGTQVFGYYWSTLLTEGHLRVLDEAGTLFG
jgi:hypothetical protein